MEPWRAVRSKWRPGGSVGQWSQIRINLMMNRIRIRIGVKSLIRIRIKVMRIRNPGWGSSRKISRNRFTCFPGGQNIHLDTVRRYPGTWIYFNENLSEYLHLNMNVKIHFVYEIKIQVTQKTELFSFLIKRHISQIKLKHLLLIFIFFHDKEGETLSLRWSSSSFNVNLRVKLIAIYHGYRYCIFPPLDFLKTSV